MAYDIMRDNPSMSVQSALQIVQQYFSRTQPPAPAPQQGNDLQAAIDAIVRYYKVDNETAAKILRGEIVPPTPPGSPEELNKAIDEIARAYGVSREVAAKILRGDVPAPTEGNVYRPPSPPGFAWAFNPASGTYELVDTSPLDPSQPLEGWKWTLRDPKDPSSGEWKFFPSRDILDDPYKGVPQAVIPWLQAALEAGGDLNAVPEGPARAWVQFLLAQAGREKQPGTVPFGLGVPNFGTPNQPLVDPAAAQAAQATQADPATSAMTNVENPNAIVGQVPTNQPQPNLQGAPLQPGQPPQSQVPLGPMMQTEQPAQPNQPAPSPLQNSNVPQMPGQPIPLAPPPMAPVNPAAVGQQDPQGNVGGGTGTRPVPIQDPNQPPSSSVQGPPGAGQRLFYFDPFGRLVEVANPDLTPQQTDALGGQSGLLNPTSHVYEPVMPGRAAELEEQRRQQEIARYVSGSSGDPEAARKVADSFTRGTGLFGMKLRGL